MGLAGESDRDDSWAIGLDAWASLDMAQRLRLLAAGDQSVEHQYTQLAKLLGRVPAVQRQHTLLDLLEQLAPLRLQWCADFLRLEAQHAQVKYAGHRSLGCNDPERCGFSKHLYEQWVGVLAGVVCCAGV